jgi:hypothetical protein
MGTKIVLEIDNCQSCPFLHREGYYSPDWYCKKSGMKKIRGYVEWHEESIIPIPDWCEIKVKE